MTKQKSELPQKLYVYAEQDGDDVYYVSSLTRVETATTDGPRLVGTYRLVDQQTVELRAKVTRVRR